MIFGIVGNFELLTTPVKNVLRKIYSLFTIQKRVEMAHFLSKTAMYYTDFCNIYKLLLKSIDNIYQ